MTSRIPHKTVPVSTIPTSTPGAPLTKPIQRYQGVGGDPNNKDRIVNQIPKRVEDIPAPIIAYSVSQHHKKIDPIWCDGSQKGIKEMLTKQLPIQPNVILRATPPKFIMIHSDPAYTTHRLPTCHFCIDTRGRIAKIVPENVVAVPEGTPKRTREAKGSTAMYLDCSGDQPAINAISVVVLGKTFSDESDPRFLPSARLLIALRNKYGVKMPVIHSHEWGIAQKIMD